MLYFSISGLSEPCLPPMGTRPKPLVTNDLNSTGPLALADALHACPLVPLRRWFILGADKAQFLDNSTPSICYRASIRHVHTVQVQEFGVRMPRPAAQIWVACRQALFNAVRPPSPHYVLWNAPAIGPPLLWENYHRCLFPLPTSSVDGGGRWQF